jgi:hypothetical protein
MNYNNVVSLPAAVNLGGQEHTAVKLTATGVDIAGAADRVIGTVIRGAAAGSAVDVFLKSEGFRFVRIGNATAIAVGDELEQAANGQFVKKTTGTAAALAIEAAPASSNGGGMIRAILL